jgi:large subunit ribosomal protein L17
MATQGRKNVHGKGGVRFKAAYTTSKNKAMLRNVVSELIIHGKVVVIKEVAKEVKKEADHLITLAKRGDLHARRQAASFVRLIENAAGVKALDVLFNELGPRFKDRNGGYTRALTNGVRRGDNATTALVTWVE